MQSFTHVLGVMFATGLLTIACGCQEESERAAADLSDNVSADDAPAVSADGAVDCSSGREDLPEYYYFDVLDARLQAPEVASLAQARGVGPVTDCASARDASALLRELTEASLDTELADSLPQHSEQKIYDGMASSMPFVVKLSIGGNLCSGSLISAQWLVTAARCFTAGGAQQVGVQLANGTVVSPAGQEFVVRHPNFGGGIGDSFDIALVRSTGWLAPANNSSSWVRVFGRQLYTNALVRIYGYGASSGTGSGLGVQRTGKRQVRVDASGSDFFRADAVAGEGRPCTGDSGGPALTQTTSFPTVAGIASWYFGTNNCPPEGAGFYYRQTGTVSTWIMNTINADPNTAADCVRTSVSDYSYLQCW
jgi:trypsin